MKRLIFIVQLLALGLPAFGQGFTFRDPALVVTAAAAGGGGTVTFDNSFHTNTTAASTYSLTFSYTTGTLTDGAMFVGVTVGDQGNAPSITNCTYNGVSLTSVTNQTYTANSAQRMYKLVSPAAGANNLVVGFSAAGGQAVAVHVVTFSQVNQTTPVTGNGVVTTGSGTTSSVTVSSSTGNAVFAIHQGGSAFSAVNQTSLGLENINDFTAGGNSGANRAAGSASVSMTGTLGSDTWGSIGIDINHN